MKYLIELDLVDGGGESSTYYYFLIDTPHYPVENYSDLTQEGLNAMKSHKNRYGYSYGVNSGYHNWKVLERGVAAELTYNMYLETVKNMKALKRRGVKVPEGFDR